MISHINIILYILLVLFPGFTTNIGNALRTIKIW